MKLVEYSQTVISKDKTINLCPHSSAAESSTNNIKCTRTIVTHQQRMKNLICTNYLNTGFQYEKKICSMHHTPRELKLKDEPKATNFPSDSEANISLKQLHLLTIMFANS